MDVELSDVATYGKDVGVQTAQLLPDVGSRRVRIEIALSNDDIEK